MLIEIEGDLINLDHVKTITPAWRGRCTVTFTDGETMLIHAGDAARIELLCGSIIIKANPGHRVITADGIGCGDRDPSFSEDEVVAYRLGRQLYGLGVITVRGDVTATLWSDWLLVTPDGKCHSGDCFGFDSIDDFKASVMKRHAEALAKRAAEAKAKPAVASAAS